MRDLPAALESELRELLKRHGMTEHYDVIRPHARLSFWMRVKPVDKKNPAPLGASRLGGTPDLADGLQWEKNPEDGKLLEFIGQINLAQVPKLGHQLPNKGLLLIYSGQEDASENPHAIQYVDDPAKPLQRAPAPTAEMFSDADEPFGALLVTDFVPCLSLPDSSIFDQQGDAFGDGYYEVLSEVSQDEGQKEPTSRLLGYPYDPTGGEMPGDDWGLLIQAEAHFSGGQCYMNFWDAGSLQMIVKHADLPTCKFTNSRVGIFSM